MPSAWPSGRVTGLRARGGFVVDIEWADGLARKAQIRSTLGGMCTVQIQPDRRPRVESEGAEVKSSRLTPDRMVFDTVAGETYGLVW